MPADSELWIPPLSPKNQKWFNRRRKSQGQAKTKWMGFSGKTLWDWLNLLGVFLIPIVITAATIWFSTQQSQVSTQVADKQHQSDMQIAQDQQQQTALQTYFGRMSDLLLNNRLHESQPGDEVRNVARALTLTVLPRLNGTRKGEVVSFLQEAGLIDLRNTIIDLRYADLSQINMNHISPSYIDLSGANLSGANLSGADLRKVILGGANLSLTNLSEANLSGTELESADLSRRP